MHYGYENVFLLLDCMMHFLMIILGESELFKDKNVLIVVFFVCLVAVFSRLVIFENKHTCLIFE